MKKINILLAIASIALVFTSFGIQSPEGNELQSQLSREGGISAQKSEIEKWKQALEESHIINDCCKKFTAISSRQLPAKDFEQYDFSKLWVKNYSLGYIGNNFQRMYMTFEKVQKKSATEYSVSGVSKVKKNVCNFTGTFKILEYRQLKEFHYGIDDVRIDDVKNQGYVFAEFIIEEDITQKNSGEFRGILATGWYINKEGELLYDDLDDYSDRYENNQFFGEWVSYNSVSPKTVAWGDSRIPMSHGLDVGAGDFCPAKKYLDNGWEEYKNY
jgi:hypothetical protein